MDSREAKKNFISVVPQIKLVLLGPPGVGKGTQARLISEAYSIPVLSTGALLRDFMSSYEDRKSLELGQGADHDNDHVKRDDLFDEIKNTMYKGELVSDAVVEEIVKNRIVQQDCLSGFILDGFPRTAHQALSLDHIMQRSLPDQNLFVLNMYLGEQDLVNRLNARFMCVRCDKVYNSIVLPTKVKNICDDCGGSDFKKRHDDNIEVIKHRMDVYMEQSYPLVRYYSQERDSAITKYLNLDASKRVGEIFKEIESFLRANNSVHYY